MRRWPRITAASMKAYHYLLPGRQEIISTMRAYEPIETATAMRYLKADNSWQLAALALRFIEMYKPFSA